MATMEKYIISKKQNIESNFKKNLSFFNSARAGLIEILKLENRCCKKILLPSYIGFSTNEGSGIFDPIREIEVDYEFYRYNNNLEIDVNYLLKKIETSEPCMILFVHYFGFKDKHFDQLKKYAKSKKFIIIEDYAHAYFTFYNKPDFDSDYIIFSLHKMFPFKEGGILYSKDNIFTSANYNDHNLMAYDIYGISERRKQNFLYIVPKIVRLKKYDVKILRRYLIKNIPQTFPILLKSREVRDYLYFELNKRGIGVVSLYHELIKEIPKEFEAEHSISDTILNLPIHQDISYKELDYMVENIEELLMKFYHLS
jgi:dTDP-4-amino-4,6-dideoxygalactose transaminase